MSLEALLNHTCDIYHLYEGRDSPGYGLPSSPIFDYAPDPDIEGQICHFGVHSASISISNTEPISIEDARVKLTLPLGVDIRLNDKVVNCATGEEYLAERPINIRDHHLYVYIKKVADKRYL